MAPHALTWQRIAAITLAALEQVAQSCFSTLRRMQRCRASRWALGGIVVAGIAHAAFAIAQTPAISVSTDSSGKARTFLAGHVNVSPGMSGLFSDIDNDLFSCKAIKPIKDGDVIPGMGSSDQFWSTDTVTVSVGGKAINYPRWAMVQTAGGLVAFLPAVITFKIAVRPGQSVSTKASVDDPYTFNIRSDRPIKAGDRITVLYLNGPTILSPAAAETANVRDRHPWLEIFVNQEDTSKRQTKLDAWRAAREHLRN